MKKQTAVSIISVLAVLAIVFCVLFFNQNAKVADLDKQVDDLKKQIETETGKASDLGRQVTSLLGPNRQPKWKATPTLNSQVEKSSCRHT